MYKLNGHSLTRGVWFIPESQAMTVQERNSVSSITLNPDAPGIDFNDWLLDCEWPEGTYVWRVRDLGDTPTNDTRNIELEHVIRVLDDTSMFGEITTEMISGGETATAEETVRYILAHQSDWVLGDFDFNVSNAYTFNGDSLLDALESVMGTLDNPVWEYDMGQYPFVLHIRERSNVVGSEMRGCRNLSTLRRSVSRNGFYTRFYPIGKNDLHITGDYLSKNENLYGRVDKVETDQTKDTEGALEAWAQGKLNRHCEPRVTITVTGLELSAETGEDLDRLKLNRYCSVPLPEFGTTICERITRLQFRDRIKEPENVTVTLCNNLLDISEIIREEQRAGSAATGRAGRAQAKQNYMFEANGEHLLYEVFDECGHLHGILRMTSESLRVAFDNAIECTRGEFLMTSESLRISFMNEIECTRSSFEMTSESLRVEFLSEISSTRSDFEMTSESLRVEFQNADTSIRSLVEQTASSWSVTISDVTDESGRVTPASIAAAINNQTGTSVVKLGADMVQIGNLSSDDLASWAADAASGRGVFAKFLTVRSLTAEELNTFLANIGDAEIDTIVSGSIESESVTIEDGLTAGSADIGSIETSSITVGEEVLNVADISISGNTMTITYVDGTTETFSKATALSAGTWSGGKFDVIASPQGETFSVGFVSGTDMRLDIGGNASGTPPLHTGSDYYIDYPIKVYQVTGDVNPPTVHTATLLVDGTAAYSNGETQGKNAVGISDLAWEHDGDYFSNHHNSTNKISNNTTGRPTQITKDASINMTQDANWASDNTKWVYVRQGTSSTGQYVAGLEVNASSVRTAGKNDVGLSDLAWEHDGDYFSNNHNSTNKISNNTTGRPTQITKDASINMTQDANWASDNTKWVYVRQGTSSTGQYVAGLEVNASSVRTAGKNDVGLSDLAWEHDGNYFTQNHNSTNKISNNTTGRPTQITKEASINMTQDANWDSNDQKWVYVRQGTSSSGDCIAGLQITAPNPKKLTSTGPALTYNGFHFPPAGYDGWSEVEVSIPMKTQEFTANTNGWVYPPSGYGGFDAIKVNVSGGGGGGGGSVTVDAITFTSGIGTIIPIRAIKDGAVADTRYLYIENSGSYTYVTLDNWYSQEPGNAVGKSSRTGSISMPSNQISTTGSWISGSYDPPSQLPSAINRAKSDGDWCYFTVSCSCGASKRYQFML